MSERKVQRQHVAAGNASGRFIVDEPGGRDALLSAFTQSYNPARRRSELAFTPTEEGTGAGRTYGFTYRGDGALTKVTAGGFANFFTYGMDGLLKTKSNALVTHGITTRDGVGRVTASTVDAGGSTILEEAFSWAVDGRMQATTALRSGTSSEGVQRNFSYNARGQLVAEDSNFLSATDWNYVYRFDRESSPDGLGLGIRTLSQRRLTSSMPTDLEPGSWLAKNAASPSSNPLDVFGRPVKEGPIVGTVNTYQERASAYDAAGNQTTRGLAGGKTQTLTWDAFGRPVQVSERDGSNNGFDFTSVYDGLGRRIRTSEQPVSSGTPTGAAKIIDSYFDPSVEFLELGVAVNGDRVWKVYGPDLSGAYGGSQGMGGLLATIEESDGTTVAVANDQMGNALARVSGSSVMWNDADLTAYGVGPGSTVPALEEASDLAETLVWRGTRQDPTGLVWMGERYYDPASGRFLSTDPLGHGASLSLYDYASGDPINFIDPDGRFGKSVNNGFKGISASSLPNTGLNNFGSILGGTFSGGVSGLRGGASITTNTLSFGGSDYFGLTNSNQYQGSEYTFSRVSSTIARESLITAATLGSAQLARAGSQGSLYAYQGLQTFNTARSGYNIGEGAYRVAEGDNRGWIQVGAGTLGVAGSISYAATNPALNSIAGIGRNSGGFAQPFVNWSNLGAQGDAAFRSLSIGQQFRSEVGMKSLSNTQFSAISGLDPIERGSRLLGNNHFTALIPNPMEILKRMRTGPSPGARVYLPGGMMIGSGVGNAVDAGR